MKKMTIGLLAAAAMMLTVPEAVAGHHGKHHEKGNDGLRLAAGIVNLVKEIITPAPQVVYAPQPAVIAPPPPPPVHRKPVYRKPVYRKPEPPRPHHAPAKPHKPQPPRGGHKR